MKTKRIVETAKRFAAEKISALINPSEKKVEQAEKRLQEAKEYLKEAERNARTAHDEWVQFRKDILEKIHTNETNLSTFKQKMEKNKDEGLKAEYEEKMRDLEHMTNELKKKIGEYKYEGKEKWENFKKSIKHSADEVGTAWKDLVKVNLEFLR